MEKIRVKIGVFCQLHDVLECFEDAFGLGVYSVFFLLRLVLICGFRRFVHIHVMFMFEASEMLQFAGEGFDRIATL